MPDNIYKDYMSYKGKPLVRADNIMYYGSLADKYVVFMMILDKQVVNGKEIAGNIQIELQQTDPNAKNRVVKTSKKKGLYEALDIASIWLARALEESN